MHAAVIRQASGHSRADMDGSAIGFGFHESPVVLAPDRYRATLVPHLLYQGGRNISLSVFGKPTGCSTEPRRWRATQRAQSVTSPVAGDAHSKRYAGKKTVSLNI